MFCSYSVNAVFRSQLIAICETSEILIIKIPESLMIVEPIRRQEAKLQAARAFAPGMGSKINRYRNFTENMFEISHKNDLRIKSLKDHDDMLEWKIRENSLIFYGINGPIAENSDETLCN
ncbi:hypothetical protein LAZ67_13001556 [Cordylochernes scorpioides]|uniref:Uncharacterized protein n=1 Tax=Cordylochernes scorpioides TaxID=51811 RepID=A0ABY6L3Y8_9ARAC|nr:hypothetical protein LAZ67_13001556 [Cordylochernes scorpioides]